MPLLSSAGSPRAVANNKLKALQKKAPVKVEAPTVPLNITLRQKIHALIDAQGPVEEAYAEVYPRVSLFFTLFSFFVIVVSVVVYSVESLPEYYERNLTSFFVLETTCVLWFSVELVLRFITCSDHCRFFLSFFNWVDLVAIMPFYMGLILSAVTDGSGAAKELIILRVIRLTRVFRVFKLSKYNDGVHIVAVTLRQSVDAVSLLLFLVVITMVIFGSSIYYAEQYAADWDSVNRTWVRKEGYGEPGSPHDFISILDGYWWCLVTVTTVGYGDKYPVSFPGYVVGLVTMFCGVMTLAFPVIIIGAKFTDIRRDYVANKILKDIHGGDSESALAEDEAKTEDEASPAEPAEETNDSSLGVIERSESGSMQRTVSSSLLATPEQQQAVLKDLLRRIEFAAGRIAEGQMLDSVPGSAKCLTARQPS